VTTNKLLEYISDLFDENKKVQHRKRDNLKKVLKQLRERKRYLKKKLHNAKDKRNRKNIKNKIDVIDAQRKKGLKLLKKLNK